MKALFVYSNSQLKFNFLIKSEKYLYLNEDFIVMLFSLRDYFSSINSHK